MDSYSRLIWSTAMVGLLDGCRRARDRAGGPHTHVSPPTGQAGGDQVKSRLTLTCRPEEVNGTPRPGSALTPMSDPIEDYALIGDGETAALVSRRGSIDWLCLPRFDSPACFAALLGGPEHGRFGLAPRDGSRSARRRYRDGTLVLETDFETADGAVTVVDCMPRREGPPVLIRQVVGRRGTRPDADGAGDANGLRLGGPLGAPIRGRDPRGGGARGPRAHHGPPAPGRGPHHRGRLRGRRRGAPGAHARLVSLPPARAATARPRRWRCGRRRPGGAGG